MEICPKCKSNDISIGKHYGFHDIYDCNNCHYWTYHRITDCCRDPFKMIVVDKKAYPQYFIREQCTHCGGCINKKKPLLKKKYGDQIRDELDKYRDQEYDDKVSQEREDLLGLKKDYNYHNSKLYKYQVYLNSPTWKHKRQQVHDRDKNICQLCKIETSEEVHHLTYKNIFKEPLEDLIAVCASCHKKEHTKPKIEQIN